MTLPNILSFSRVPLLFVILACLMINKPGFATAGLVAFLLAMLSDWLDGFFARLFKQTTSVGALMDALIDKIFLLGLFFYFLHIRIIPDWGMPLLIIMMTREFIITGMRQCALLRRQVISSEMHGKIKTVLQFLSLFLMMLVPFFTRDMGGTPEMIAWADFFKFFGRLTFGLSAILTITSGFYYLYKYRDVLAFNREESISPF